MAKIIEPEINNRIRQIRLEKGLTQKQLAEKSGMYESQIRKYETGKALPKINTLKKIADSLDVPVSDLIEPTVFQPSRDLIDLFSGKKIEKVGETISDNKELALIEKYRKLNDTGKAEAVKRVSELAEIKKYTEPEEE